MIIDIGTGSLVALVYEETGGTRRIVSASSRGYGERYIRDGLVEDVPGLAAELGRLLDDMGRENLPGEAVVAVASREMRSVKGRFETRRGRPEKIDEAAAAEIFSSALMETWKGLEGDNSHYLLEWTVARLLVDGSEVRSLIGQTALSAEVELKAVFVPRRVVESKIHVVEANGLEVSGVLLEPMAALAASGVKATGRGSLLVVDIGAGTTDIAAVLDGRISDIVSVPWAGDEVTEALAERFLLPFGEAERLKCSPAGEGLPEVRDGLSRRVDIDPEEVSGLISGAAEREAGIIARAAGEMGLNEVGAILLAGGGARLQGLKRHISGTLHLPLERIIVRGAEETAGIEDTTGIVEGPEMITPVGLVKRAEAASRPREVSIDGVPAMLMIPPGGMTAGEALMAAGRPPGRLYGRPGRAVGVTIREDDGEERIVVIPGEPGGRPRIEIDGVESGPEGIITGGETIVTAAGAPGRAASPMAGEIPDRGIRIDANGRKIRVRRRFRMGDRDLAADEPVRDEAVLVPIPPRISDILPEAFDPVMIDGKPVRLALDSELKIERNGAAASPDDEIFDGDEIRVAAPGFSGRRITDLLDGDTPPTLSLVINAGPVLLRDRTAMVTLNGRRVRSSETAKWGDRIETTRSGRRWLMTDILTEVDPPKRRGSGGRISITRDGIPAGWNTPIYSGDSIEIAFEEAGLQ